MDNKHYVTLLAGSNVTLTGSYPPYNVTGNNACPGTHTLNITADYFNQVAELDEANNGYQLKVTC